MSSRFSTVSIYISLCVLCAPLISQDCFFCFRRTQTNNTTHPLKVPFKQYIKSCNRELSLQRNMMTKARSRLFLPYETFMAPFCVLVMCLRSAEGHIKYATFFVCLKKRANNPRLWWWKRCISRLVLVLLLKIFTFGWEKSRSAINWSVTIKICLRAHFLFHMYNEKEMGTTANNLSNYGKKQLGWQNFFIMMW